MFPRGQSDRPRNSSSRRARPRSSSDFFSARCLINNFVFTQYLGLCIFFGVSQKKDTAIGMGITFTMVMVAERDHVLGPFFTFVLAGPAPGLSQDHRLHRDGGDFCSGRGHHPQKGQPIPVQETRRVPGADSHQLHHPCGAAAKCGQQSRAFCQPDPWPGRGLGFALALFLMACVREKLEVCRVPPTFQGLPIAFIVTGLFALAFLGFSGLAIF